MMTGDINDLEETAYHEAGHAVAAVVLRYHLTSCTIVPSFYQGQVLYSRLSEPLQPMFNSDNWQEASRRGDQQEMIVTMAGPMAQSGLCCDWPMDYAAMPGAEHDIRHCEAIAVERSGTRYNAYWNRYERCAARLVCKHWFAIQAVAAALLERQTLTGDEVRAIMAAASSGKPMLAA